MKKKKVSYFKSFGSKPEEVDLLYMLGAIKEGAYRERIEHIQKLDEKEYGEAEQRLPHFTPSGTYNQKRRREDLSEYNQVIVLDINDVEYDIQNIKKKASEIDYTLAAFLGQGGKGVKILVNTDSTIETHEIAFKQVVEYYEKKLGIRIDTSGKDISRACFVSWDSDLYINEDCNQYHVSVTNMPIYAKPITTDIRLEKVLQYTEEKELKNTIESAYKNESGNLKSDYSEPSITSIPEFKERSLSNPFIMARTLFEKEVHEIPSLIEPIIPKVGVIAVVGSSDLGKSTFLRQMAFQVAYGEKYFVGYPINATHNRVIYVSTEDDEASINKLLKIQFGMPEHLERTERLKYIFETDNLLNKLEKEAIENPVDMIIIDAFADLYTGELNANNKVRGFLNEYREMALRNNLLIVFLHHTGKRTEYGAPSKNNAIGSQGFEAKMRLMIEIRKDPNFTDIRHLCIVKGNYLPEEYKTHSIVTRFNSYMLFENLNCSVPFEELTMPTDKNEAREKALQLKVKGSSIRSITDILNSEGYKVGKSTVGEWLKGQ